MYKERASQIGKIMTDPRGKSNIQRYQELTDRLNDKLKRLNGLSEKAVKSREKLEEEIPGIRKAIKELEPVKYIPLLSDTAKSRIQDRLLEDKFGIRKEFWSKHTDKGNECEEESIHLTSRALGLFGVRKNEEHYEDQYFTGTPDIITGDLVIDVKSSWSGNTYPWFMEAPDNMDYVYQLQIYMHLTGRKKSILAYCLINTPEDIIQDEIRRQAWQHKLIEPSNEFEDKVRAQMEFEHIPEHLRVRTFEIDYDPELIQRVIERIELCREYYASLEEELNNRKTFN